MARATLNKDDTKSLCNIIYLALIGNWLTPVFHYSQKTLVDGFIYLLQKSLQQIPPHGPNFSLNFLQSLKLTSILVNIARYEPPNILDNFEVGALGGAVQKSNSMGFQSWTYERWMMYRPVFMFVKPVIAHHFSGKWELVIHYCIYISLTFFSSI